MRLYLTHKGLNSCIEPEERTDDQLSARSAKSKAKKAADWKKALSLIGLKVKPKFLGVIEDADGSARTAWEEFTLMFQSVGKCQKAYAKTEAGYLEDGAL
jgi:hypothetical protein